MPVLSGRRRICRAAACRIFCLHLLVCCGLVTGLFSPASSLAVHLKVAHILLLPLMVSKRPYLRVNSHLWSSHNDKVVLLRVLLLAKNLLLQKSKAISKLIYWTLHSEQEALGRLSFNTSNQIHFNAPITRASRCHGCKRSSASLQKKHIPHFSFTNTALSLGCLSGRTSGEAC